MYSCIRLLRAGGAMGPEVCLAIIMPRTVKIVRSDSGAYRAQVWDLSAIVESLRVI